MMRARAMDFRAQGEGVFDELRRIEEGVVAGVIVERVPYSLVPSMRSPQTGRE